LLIPAVRVELLRLIKVESGEIDDPTILAGTLSQKADCVSIASRWPIRKWLFGPGGARPELIDLSQE
jgi:hypothetical protein